MNHPLTPFETTLPRDDYYKDRIIAALQKKMKKDYASGSVKRDAHPKNLGLLQAEFTVENNLPDHLRVGIFKEVRTYQAWIRFSNSNGNVQSDVKKDIRGIAIKVLGVEGEKFLPQGEMQTQDFLMVSCPTMPLGTVKMFHEAIYYSIEWSPLVFLFRMLVSGNLSVLKVASQAKLNHTSPLDIRYWSTTPYLFGDDAAVKYSLVPTSQYQSELPAVLSDSYLTEQMEAHLSKQEASFDLLVQKFKDQHSTPIEDASVEWKEADAPFVKVATLRIPMQVFRTAEREALSEDFSFSPGHCLTEHRPIGGINRARMEIYNRLSQFRHQENHRPLVEPAE
ncbi:catalase family protein [Tumebacillus sp. ITR2]|uniref:Catalase family protein n=1 Tax=Tumebacillus amylolyticus TaxID=2801339 RepID=A0ABS1JB38_9BACL|nr:catalase family protein [Tumebacillus amylolyticus]MBL0387450.1 catalase family protein [Tumebacillus amylolyticus]